MKNMDFLAKLQETTGGEPVQDTLCVLFYEFGDAVKAVMRAKWAGSDKGYHEEMVIALGDMWVQWWIVCQQLGLDPVGVSADGITRFCERMASERK